MYMYYMVIAVNQSNKYVLVCFKGKKGIKNKVPDLAIFPPCQILSLLFGNSQELQGFVILKCVDGSQIGIFIGYVSFSLYNLRIF